MVIIITDHADHRNAHTGTASKIIAFVFIYDERNGYQQEYNTQE